MQLLRKTRYEWGVEYAYRIPLGLSFSDFEQKMQHLEDGLNHKSKVYDFKLSDFKSLRLRKDILKQIQNIINKKKLVRKEIELSYDGLLKIRVYEKGIPDFVKFEEDMMKQCRGWEVPIGYTRDGLVKHDFDQLAHMISAGMTDMGKSNVLKLIITSLVRNQSENIKLYLIDLKSGLSFNRYRFLNQVESIAKNPEEALETLRELQDKLNARNEYLLEKGYEDIKEAGDPTRYFVIVDEAADMTPYQECRDIIVDIGVSIVIGSAIIFSNIIDIPHVFADGNNPDVNEVFKDVQSNDGSIKNYIDGQLYNRIVNAFEPVIFLIKAVSYPIASVVALCGGLFIMVGSQERGFSLISRAGIGYIVVQMIPLFMRLLVEIAKAI
ncbi:FtsK/SpoIIIE domain-containing protein [Bacillus paranthracis]|nr:FtsK/SpoIIIE domain-containing protein [Bacillus paranthracis]MED1683541.1 FtsK/SpoIIIE domain-containing protein [Bacillus paranthracis]